MEINFLQHALYKILNAPIRLYPYPHLFVEEVFPADFYRRLLDKLPPDEFMKSITELGKALSGSGTYESRALLMMLPMFLDTLPEELQKFWKGFSKKMLSETFEMGMRLKFGSEMDRLEKSLKAKPQYLSQMELVRDRKGYALGPHTDSEWKVMTALFYLPEDRRYERFGTSIMVPKPGFNRGDPSKHHKYDDFDLVYTLPFVPNSFFCFFRSEHSWHSVLPVDDPELVRNSICWRLVIQNHEEVFG
ncbi:MAG: hypothetical protein KDK48_01660 [Chlamydiia bacterium]|nr:hypothetical protein [Chlamydiia bacterium]